MAIQLKALRERRDAIAKDLQDLVDKDKTPNWGADQQVKYEAAMKDIADIDADIKRYNDVLVTITNQGGIADDDRNKYTRDTSRQEGDNAALRAYLSGGINALDEHQFREQQARQSQGDIRAAMSTATPSEGGYTVATEYYRHLTEAMKQTGGIRQVATILTGGTGAQMNFPTADATSEEGEIVGQNESVSESSTTFQNVTLDVYKYSSRSIAVPFELIQDSMFDIEAYIQQLLVQRIGRITDKHFTIGTGNLQPKGIVTASSVGVVAAAGGVDTITYDNLVDLEHSVDPAYRFGSKVGFMMHDMSLKAVRKIKDQQGRPIFVPGYEQGNPGGAPDRLMGRPIFINQSMSPMQANAKSVAFGDFSRYMIRQVMDLTLFRMVDSKYTLKGQVGFVGFNRQGGNLIDVGGAVKLFQNSAS